MNVDLHPSINVLSLCSGYGGIDLGLRLALPATRTICYLEREATVAQILAARFEDGALDEAPIWSDVKTFDGKPWRGLVDILCGGYPCQPFSCAGKQLAEKDPRHLWPHIARIVREVEPEWVFLENVDAHLRLGFHEVADELEAMDYRVACGLFSAQEVGAPHRRLRLFALAHRNGAGLRSGGIEKQGLSDKRRADVAHLEAGRRGELRQPSRSDGLLNGSIGAMEDAPRHVGSRQVGQGSGRGRGIRQAGTQLADAGDGLIPLSRRRPGGRTGIGPASAAVADAQGFDRRSQFAAAETATERQRRPGRHGPSGIRGTMADTSEPRLPLDRNGRYSEAEQPSALGSGWAFPPGPNDLPGWQELLAVCPQVEPAICRGFDGITPRVDRLRALGNGVVPLVVAHAYRTLRRAFD